MRRALAGELINLAEQNQKIFFITADLGFGVFDEFKARFPNRYINVGIAEAGMVGLASGLTKEGFIPIIYSIASFMNSRAYEQIKVLAGYNESKMVIIGAGGGLLYSKSGPTHHSLDDLGLALMIPNMLVAAPAGPQELRNLLRTSVNANSSTYIQIGKFGEEDVSDDQSSNPYNSEFLVISTGNASHIVKEAKKLKPNLFNWVHSTYLRPLDEANIIKLCQKRSQILIVEDSWENSGLYNQIVLLLQRNFVSVRVVRLGPPTKFILENASIETLQNIYGYSPHHIILTLELRTYNTLE